MTHMSSLKRSRRGQALLLVTLSLFTMCGLLGLAVDLGWSYFIKKSAQNAADSAALADAYQALSAVGETGPFSVYTDTPAVGLAYAQQNLFSPGGNGGRQNVTITPNLGTVTRLDGTTVQPCSGNPGMVGCVEYSVTVRTVETIPQLFSAILGNGSALSSARSTAAVVQELVNGSIILLNRNDANEPFPNGIGIDAVANPIGAQAGVVVASTLPGTIPSGGVTGPIFAMRPVASPGLPDGPQFLDPMRGYGQPPLPTTDPDGQCGKSLCTYAVMGSDMSSSSIFRVGVDGVADTSRDYGGGGSPTLPSGNYVPSTWAPGCGPTSCHSVRPSNQLSIGGTVTFNDPSVPFGYYLFYGGLSVSGGKMVMGQGEYVFIGGGGAGALTTSSISDIEGTGTILILTGASGPFTGNVTTASGPTDLYPNLLTQINSNELLVAAAEAGQLAFGPTSLSTGPKVNVTGLDPTGSVIPQNLIPFGGIVLWQDQADSKVNYMPDGNIDISCGGINTPCPKSIPNPVLNLQASGNLGLTGTIYQPRGAWISIGTGTLTGNLQVITGAVTGGGGVSLAPPTSLNLRLRRRVVALIE
jgi:Flp pilus assembly protein TadG